MTGTHLPIFPRVRSGRRVNRDSGASLSRTPRRASYSARLNSTCEQQGIEALPQERKEVPRIGLG